MAILGTGTASTSGGGAGTTGSTWYYDGGSSSSSDSGSSSSGSSGSTWTEGNVASGTAVPVSIDDPYDTEAMSTATKDLESGLGTPLTETDAYKAADDTVSNLKAPTTDRTLLDEAGDIVSGVDLDGLKEDANIGRVDHVNIDEETAMLNQLKQSQIDQSNAQIDNSVNTSITDLQRTMQDSQEEYQTQRDQIDTELQRALDNSVLTSAARGDRGGIGVAQYNTIQNTAASNKLTVQKEQTKLATDTARQITDLRANGEFQKADNLLTITQNYLSQLMELYQWAKETNVSIDEFNIGVDEWENNYKLSLAEADLNVASAKENLYSTYANADQNEFSSALNLANAQLNMASTAENANLNRVNAQLNIANATGAFSDGNLTLSALQARNSNILQQEQYNLEALQNSGQTLLEAGVIPTEEQLAAMGMTKAQAVAYLNKYYAGQAPST